MKEITKRILALILCAVMVCTLFAACQSSQSESESSAEDSSEASTPASTGDEEEASEDNSDSLLFDPEEIVNVSMYYIDFCNVSAEHGERITNAINEYTEATYGIHINLTFANLGDYMTKVQLAISGGDCVDLMPMVGTVAQMYSNNMLLPLDDLIAEYAPAVTETVGDYFNVFTYSGQLYAVPLVEKWAAKQYIIMRKDTLDELGLTEKAQNLSSWSEYEEILAAVTEACAGTGMYAVCKSASTGVLPAIGHQIHGDNFSDIEVYDTLNDSANVVYVNDEGKVLLYQQQDATVEEMKMVKKWADNGWVWPDSALSDLHADEIMAQGVSFSNIQNAGAGLEISKGATIGCELVCTPVWTKILSTTTVATFACGIPVSSEEPEAAAYIMNAFYSDATLMNLITWGEEGVDYNVVDGQVQHVEESHYNQDDWLFGNCTLLLPLYGWGADFYEQAKVDNENLTVSPYMGFALDISDLELEISQITAVNDEFTATLYSGGYTDELYNSYIEKLEVAGVNDYLSAIQTQLDAWLAAN